MRSPREGGETRRNAGSAAHAVPVPPFFSAEESPAISGTEPGGPGASSASFRRPPVGPRPGQRFHHLFHGGLRGIEGYRVDLPHAAESLAYAYYPVQPFQGRFPDVVSGHVKRDHRIIPGRRFRIAGLSGRRQDKETKDHGERKNRGKLTVGKHRHYLRGIAPINDLLLLFPTAPRVAGRGRTRIGSTCTVSGFSCSSAGGTPRQGRTRQPG